MSTFSLSSQPHSSTLVECTCYHLYRIHCIITLSVLHCNLYLNLCSNAKPLHCHNGNILCVVEQYQLRHSVVCVPAWGATTQVRRACHPCVLVYSSMLEHWSCLSESIQEYCITAHYICNLIIIQLSCLAYHICYMKL